MPLSNSGRLALRFSRQAECAVAEIPTFLCPLLARSLQPSKLAHNQPQKSVRIHRRYIQSQAQEIPETSSIVTEQALTKLPSQCAGCGALSQITVQDEAGFYSLTRRSVKEYLGTSYSGKRTKATAEDEVVKKALENVDSTILETLGMEKPASTTISVEPPVCDRCHNLKNHQTGVSIYHPSVRALQQTISESPYKYNHIYHIIDAADFPMSFIPALTRALNVTPQRSYNRRSKAGKFYSDRKTEVDFVITRSDLLAPTKALVDGMMPYLTSVLRDALGRAGKGVRLGNVRCVSAERGWWTTKLKEDIFERGGGNWMVGKVNVGKSRLFHEVFPKGRGKNEVVVGEPLLMDAQTDTIVTNDALSPMVSYKPMAIEPREVENELPEDESDDTMSLLPPAQKETAYPSMPLVSSLPGTTASPIRVPFGNGKGELIDLPGISRGELELHVQPAHRNSLVMKTRVKPEQKVMKPGQSLVLGGGLIRITPVDPDIIMMAYAFTSMDPKPHLTSTEKAIVMQSRGKEPFIDNITLPGTEEKIASAGVFPLRWDVTKARIGPATNSLVDKGKVAQLPFQILSTDLLIEGCGWVELVAQVSKSRLLKAEPAKYDRADDQTWGWADEEAADEMAWPSVEVFTPEGKFIAARRPMNAWMLNAKKPSKTKARPPRSMKGVEKSRRARANAARA
ncbi:Mitochondrial ribosome small subunit biogenesis protein [Ciborinia camelliae]|nr:Mitochondrial ribosome small subunit biogenesis protein [Ciborinia camelliae]